MLGAGESSMWWGRRMFNVVLSSNAILTAFPGVRTDFFPTRAYFKNRDLSTKPRNGRVHSQGKMYVFFPAETQSSLVTPGSHGSPVQSYPIAHSKLCEFPVGVGLPVLNR